jgi:hypothetical protein
MVIIERYPGTGTRRLDHPDFGDVYETTYGEGIIKDFGLADIANSGSGEGETIIGDRYGRASAGGQGTNPITLDGTCTVEVAGKVVGGIPIFYHCRKGGPPAPPPAPPPIPPEWEWCADFAASYSPAILQSDEDDGAGFLEDNGSLRRGAWAFWKGQKVKVLLQKGVPKCVVGHTAPESDTVETVPGQTPPAYWEDPEVVSPASKPPYKCHNIFLIKTWDWSGFSFTGTTTMAQRNGAKKQRQCFYVNTL